MPLTKTNVELSYANVVTGTPVVVDIPAFAVEEIYVKYGAGKLFAQPGLDYLLTLDEPVPIPPPTTQFYQFVTVTPTASLLAKIATDGTNIMYVGRLLALTTDFTELDAFTRANLDVEFARTNMKLQQLEASDVQSTIPDPRVGHPFQFIRVNAATTGYEFIDIPGGGDMLRLNNLSDVIDPVISLSNIGGQPHNILLDALSALSAFAGYVVHDGISSFAKRVFTAGAGITLGNPDGIAGNTSISVTGGVFQPINPKLSGLSGMDNTLGFVVEQAVGVFLKRVMAATVGAGILISNPAGTAGNPTFTIDQAFAPTWSGAHTFSNTNAITLTGASATIALVAPSGNPAIIISGVVGVARHIMFRSDTRERWRFLTDATGETGSNVGSDFRIFAMNDAGTTAIFTPMVITRSTGAVSFGTSISVPVGGMLYNGVDILGRANTWTADQVIQKANAIFNVIATSGNVSEAIISNAGGAFLTIAGPAGNARLITFKNSSTIERWRVQVDGAAEGGSDAGSNFQLQRYADDGSTMLGNVLSFSRATGDWLTDIEIDKGSGIIRAHSSTNNSLIGYIEQINHRGDGNPSFFGRFGAGFRSYGGGGIVATQVLGEIAFGGQWGTDTVYTPAKMLYAASIGGVAEGSFTAAGAMPTALAFRVGVVGDALAGPNVYYGTEYMRLASNGGLYAIGVTGGSKGLSGGIATANFQVLYEAGVALNVKYMLQVGTATNDNAAAGMIGEFMIATTGAIALTSNVVNAITSLPLTAGDWEVSYRAAFNGAAGTTITFTSASTSTTSGVTSGGDQSQSMWNSIAQGGNLITESNAGKRYSFAAPTTVYLNVNAVFAVSTETCVGEIRARRMR